MGIYVVRAIKRPQCHLLLSSIRLFLGRTGTLRSRTYLLRLSLTGIGRRTVDIKGQRTEFVDFIFKDEDQTYNVSAQLGGSIARGERMPDLDKVIGDDGTQKYDGSTRLAWMQNAVDRINAHIARSKDDGDVIF